MNTRFSSGLVKKLRALMPVSILLLLLALSTLLAILGALTARPALADAGVPNTPTQTNTPLPTATLTPTLTPTLAILPSTSTPTVTSTVAPFSPTQAPALIIAPEEPQDRGPNLVCWPFIVLFILIVIIGAIVLLGNRPQTA